MGKDDRTTNVSPLTISEIDQLLDNLRIKQAEENVDNGYYHTETMKVMKIHQDIEKASKQIESIFIDIQHNGKIHLQEIEESIVPLIKQATEIPHLYHLFYELKSKDEYTYMHSISVGIIATQIGEWIGLSDQELNELALAAVLHDIGKSKIPSHILNKPGKLTEAEFKKMKLHTIYGYDILKEVPNIGNSILQVVLQHHEREDGGGYPFSLKGNEIHLYAKIVAIADVFHAMSSVRVYHDAAPFYEVMKSLYTDAFGKLDPQILLVFINKMMESLVGRQVLLSNEQLGKLVFINRYDPFRSLVQIDKEIIDLRKHPDLQIKKILSNHAG